MLEFKPYSYHVSLTINFLIMEISKIKHKVNIAMLLLPQHYSNWGWAIMAQVAINLNRARARSIKIHDFAAMYYYFPGPTKAILGNFEKLDVGNYCPAPIMI